MRKELLGWYLGPEFIPESRNVVLHGPSGVGRTHLAAARRVQGDPAWGDARFVTCVYFVEELSKGESRRLSPGEVRGVHASGASWWSMRGATCRMPGARASIYANCAVDVLDGQSFLGRLRRGHPLQANRYLVVTRREMEVQSNIETRIRALLCNDVCRMPSHMSFNNGVPARLISEMNAVQSQGYDAVRLSFGRGAQHDTDIKRRARSDL